MSQVRGREGSRAATRPEAGQGRIGAQLDSEQTRHLEQLLSAKEVVVACGPGGVGKTTTSAALAATAAARLGGRVLVLTVDPARRLADALGVGGLGNVARRVPPTRRSPTPAYARRESCTPPCSTWASRGTRSSAGMRPTR